MDRNSKANNTRRYSLTFCCEVGIGYSPYRLVAENEKEVAEVNEYLDAQAVRGLSERSLRAYGYSLLNFWKWLAQQKFNLHQLREADLWNYIRFQYEHTERKVAPRTVNQRLRVVRCLYRYHTGTDIPSGSRVPKTHPFPYPRGAAADLGYLLHPARAKSAQAARGVKVPRRVVVPLTTAEVAQFLESLRTWRDMSIVALMLLCGLRSREVLGLLLEDLHLSGGEARVRGKGDKQRVVPLAPQAIAPLRAYLTMERPQAATPNVFLCLKGRQRGAPMTAAGLRSLFRYHRKRSRVSSGNPHRFRHTFGADMARAGMSIPALMNLMGHANIHTTMIYVELSPQDVRAEFQRVIDKMNTESARAKTSGDEKRT